MLKDYWYVFAVLAVLGITASFILRKGLNENAAVKDRLISISIALFTIIPLYLAVININSLNKQTDSNSPSSIFSDLKNFADSAQQTIDETKSLKENLTKTIPDQTDQAAFNPGDIISLSRSDANPILISSEKEAVSAANKYIAESDTYNLLKLISDKKIFSIKSGALATVTKVDNENKLLAVKITSLSEDDKSLGKIFINKEFWVSYEAATVQNPPSSQNRELPTPTTTP